MPSSKVSSVRISPEPEDGQRGASPSVFRPCSTDSVFLTLCAHCKLAVLGRAQIAASDGKRTAASALPLLSNTACPYSTRGSAWIPHRVIKMITPPCSLTIKMTKRWNVQRGPACLRNSEAATTSWYGTVFTPCCPVQST